MRLLLLARAMKGHNGYVETNLRNKVGKLEGVVKVEKKATTDLANENGDLI